MELLDKLLQDMDFEPRAASVLRALIEHGEMSAREISRLRKLPRSTCYAILDTLTSKGIVTPAAGGESRYKISSPGIFSVLISSEKERLAARESAALQISNIMSIARENSAGVPKLHFCTGKREIETFLSSRLLTWRESVFTGDSTWWGYQDDAFVEQYIHWLQMAWHTTAPEEKVWLLSNPASRKQENRRSVPGREIRAVPSGFSFASTIWVAGDYIVLISTRTKPHYAIELRDSVFSSSLRDVFRLVWHFSL